MKSRLHIVALLLLVQGCTSIEQPRAQRPLVEHDYVFPADAVKASLAHALTNTAAGAYANVNGVQTQFGNHFFAASGMTCRKTFSQQAEEQIYCRRDENLWFAVNKVIAEYSPNQELEAKK